MRLYLRVARGTDVAPADLVVDCEDGTTVADLARFLTDPEPRRSVATAAHGPAGSHPDAAWRFGVVGSDGAVRRVGDATGASDTVKFLEPSALWMGSTELDPGQDVAASPLRHGATVGLDGPVRSTGREPQGVVEVRISSGPGAGNVRRLGPGRHTVGTSVNADVRVEAPDVPAVAVVIEVRVDGTVTLHPDEEVLGAARPPAPRVVPLRGPIVVQGRDDELGPDEPESRRARRRRLRRERKQAAADPSSADAALDAAGVAHVIVDPEEPAALVALGRLPLDEATPWVEGEGLTVGPAFLDLVRVTAPDAVLTPSGTGATLDFNRPPRLMPAPRRTEYSLPKRPTRGGRPPIPFVMVVAPVIMGLVSALVFNRWYMLLFVLLSPIMMFANHSQGRRTEARRFDTQSAEWVTKTRAIKKAAFEALIEERRARRDNAPSPADVLLMVIGPRARLWERRPVDRDWLSVRVGTADVPSEVVLRDPAREMHEGPVVWTAPDVPATVSLAAAGVTGIAGPGDTARVVSRWVLGQVAALHSPAELRIVLLTAPGRGTDAPDAWGWVRWLPHLRVTSDGSLGAVGSDDETLARRIAELTATLEDRQAEGRPRGAGQTDPVLVVLDGARELRSLPGVIPLLRNGPAHAITFLCLDDDVRMLPEECSAVVSGTTASLTLERTGEDTIEAIRPDLVPPAWAEQLARSLAPINDVSRVDAAGSIPGSSRLLSVLRMDPPTHDAVSAGWRRGGRTTAAVIGEGADGPFELDIRRDGPHGLVAGTTGSGKSELLQTIIASLAVGNRPDEMTFVLVDYKGGAAFKDCALLPHTVGMVTDLDGHLTTRALESLGAELRRREHQLADAGAKDIEDYLAARQPDHPPMPRLLIVIDEFAALVAELPDFVNGLVDIARRGRSLGVHLILATQRPSGVVSAEIKSNTNLRIALRVTDTADSQDVIESDAAAHVAQSTPGRAYARLGHSQLMPFQSARVGGRPPVTSSAAEITARPLTWDGLGRPAPRASTAGDDDITTPTDLTSLVTAIAAAADNLGIAAPPSPWLPALADTVTLDDVLREMGHERPGPGAPTPELPVDGGLPALPLGMSDEPWAQRQIPMVWDFSRAGHLAIGGQARSGRSAVLRLLAGAVARLVSPADLHLYAIDCGNGALLPLVTMPHVGAVVTREQPDRLRRLLMMLSAEVARRQQLLASQGYADVAEQRRECLQAERLPYLMVLLDRWDAYVGAFESTDGGVLLEQLMKLLREGTAMGLRFAIAGDRSVLNTRMGAVVEDRLVLRLPAPEDYSVIGMRGKDVPATMPPGRAFRAGEHVTEVQVALLTDSAEGTAQVAALHAEAAAATTRLAARGAGSTAPGGLVLPRRVDELPTFIPSAAFEQYVSRPLGRSELVVGVGGDTLGVRTLDVEVDGPGYLVVGPPRSGRSSALLVTLTSALDRGWTAVVVAPRRSPLRELASRRGVQAVLTSDDTADTLRAALDVPGPRMLVIDDFDVLGADHALAGVAEEYLKSIRDSGDALVVSAGIDELAGLYRGAVALLRKTRTGLILSPRASGDGDVFTVRLPRSVGGSYPQGRGVLARTTGWEWVQVPAPVA